MPRPRQPARLHAVAERRSADGSLKQAAHWIIKDGTCRIGTGCGIEDRTGAERKLAEYLARQHSSRDPEPNRTAAEIPVADVIAHYAKVIASDPVARPVESSARLGRLLDWWGDKTLAQINGHTCRAFAQHRGTASGARRDLEDLRAAIGVYCADGLCRDYIRITLPKRPGKRMSYFTRDQIAALVWHCYRHRRQQKGRNTTNYPLRHLVPFILTAVYTGTRSRRIWTSSYVREEGRPWVDLEAGIFYREAAGEVAAWNKKADPVRPPARLLAHMRRWSRPHFQSGYPVEGRRYVTELHGKPGDPKKALTGAMNTVFGEGHSFVRHTFRHTCATWLMWAGDVDVGHIAKFMSMTREMVVNVYGKEHPDADRFVGDAFSTGRAGRLPGRRKRGDNRGEKAPSD